MRFEKHEQIIIYPYNDKRAINVDEGLEDVIQNFFNHNFPTSLSCISINEREEIWIEFEDFEIVKRFMQKAFDFDEKINIGKFVRETIYGFMMDIAFTVVFIGEEAPTHVVSMVIRKDKFEKFKSLFFECFPLH